MAKHRTDDARSIPWRYSMGTRAFICEQGRISIGRMIAPDETPREPIYGIRFTESRRPMFRADEIAVYSASRYETLDGALCAIFAAFQMEDVA
jgi:hypothetical protein